MMVRFVRSVQIGHPYTPSSQPLITFPTPISVLNGCPLSTGGSIRIEPQMFVVSVGNCVPRLAARIKLLAMPRATLKRAYIMYLHSVCGDRLPINPHH